MLRIAPVRPFTSGTPPTTVLGPYGHLGEGVLPFAMLLAFRGLEAKPRAQ
jgi:hypothetical protein